MTRATWGIMRFTARWVVTHIERSARGLARRGFVLPVVMFALIITSVVAIAAFRTADDEQQSALSFREATRAQYAAEAGLRFTLGQWPTAAAAALNPGDSADQGWQTLLDHSSYRSVIYRVDKGSGLQAFAVVSQSRREGGLAASSTVTQMVFGVPPLFRWGIFTQGDMSITGGAFSDGYNSASGPYTTATSDSTGSIAANGNIALNGGSTVVMGDATAAGTITTGSSVVTGTSTPNAPPFPVQPILTCPVGGYTPAASVPGGAGIVYSSVTGTLTVSSGANLLLTATQYYFHRVTMSGNSTLTINGGGAHVDLWVDDLLDLSGGGIANTGNLPTSLGIWSCGASTSTWTLTGGAGAYFSVYAPNHPINLTGGGDLYGAIIGGSLTATGGTKVHYDEALGNKPSGLLTTDRRNWAQLP